MRKLLPLMMATLIVACKKYNDHPNEVTSTDKNFLVQTYLVSKEEIKAGELASNKATNPVIQNFSRRIVADYRSAQLDLIAVADKLNFSLADTVTIGTQTSSVLTELNGFAFDTAYMKSRTRNLLQTLTSFQNELNNGNNTYIRYYFLNKYIDKVRAYYYEADSISRAL